MGSSQLLRCSAALLLLLVLASASSDLFDPPEQMMEQHEVTFDLEAMMQGMQKPDMMQHEIDLSDLVNLKDFMQPEIYDKGQAMPRSFMPAIQFPLARPSAENLRAICSNSAHRPRYPDTYFPNSGYGQQRRRATAVNNAESWFSGCCQRNATWGSETTLCCAIQAWEHHAEAFCTEDTAVKDRIYKCCKKRGGERLDCFHNDAPNPNYDQTEKVPVSPVASNTEFNFEHSTCQRPVVTPHGVRQRSSKQDKKRKHQPPSSQKVSINFPLGCPTADNVESLCQNQKLRPLYSVKCLAGSRYKLLTRQAKSINRMEKGFKQCCKKKQGVLDCVGNKWREELSLFCEKQSGKKENVQCCSQDLSADERFKCFQDASPDPNYNVTVANEELTLNKICEVHKLLKKKFPVGLPLKAFVSQCCPLSDESKAGCFEQKIKESSVNLCSSKKDTSPAVRRCCRTASEDLSGCLSKLAMDAITKVAHKKKKRCPLVSN